MHSRKSKIETKAHLKEGRKGQTQTFKTKVAVQMMMAPLTHKQTSAGNLTVHLYSDVKGLLSSTEDRHKIVLMT